MGPGKKSQTSSAKQAALQTGSQSLPAHILANKRAGHSAFHYSVHFSKRIVFGGLILTAIALLGALAPSIAPIDSAISPLHIDLTRVNLPLFACGHLLGTDYMGRDVLAQAAWGARASLSVGLFAALAAVTFGSLWGSVSAFAGGIVDAVMMRIVDGLLAIPSIILLLAINSLISTPSLVDAMPAWVLSLFRVTQYSFGLLPLFTVVVVISATTWLESARISRAKITAVKEEEYIAAATALGSGPWHMITRHLLPNAAIVLMVEGTLLVSDAVLMEAGLSFLGLGLGPSTPSWGTMLSSAQLSVIEGNWWAVLIPGLLITITVSAVNLLGEGWLELIHVKTLPSA